MKNVEKNYGKTFTKNNGKVIIRKKYNPSNESEGLLLMKETKDIIKYIVIELSTKYNKKEQMIQTMLEKCMDLGYSLKESEELIEIFFKEFNLSKTCPMF